MGGEDPGCLAGRGETVYNRLDFLDVHRVRLGNGSVASDLRDEPGELFIDHPKYEGYGYSINGNELVFDMPEAETNRVRECRYRLSSSMESLAASSGANPAR